MVEDSVKEVRLIEEVGPNKSILQQSIVATYFKIALNRYHQLKQSVLRFVASDALKQEVAIVVDDIMTPMVATEWGRRASWGVSSLLGLLTLAAVIQTITTWYDDIVIAHSTVARAGAQSAMDSTAQLITQIPEEHIFGKLGNEGALPITSLQIRLVGVIKSEPESQSRVIISEAGQPGKVYAIGDTLPSGIMVNAIADDGVILENGGHLEKLPLRRSTLSFQGMPKPLLPQEENQS